MPGTRIVAMKDLDISHFDSQIQAALSGMVDEDPEYWSFRDNAARHHAHGIFHYPAMMVPQMQAHILSDLCCILPDIQTVFDPFLGAGTVLTEAMLMGKDFLGQDINPLAILVSKVKSGPYFTVALYRRLQEIRGRIASDSSNEIEIRYDNWEKWFKREVAIQLSKIVRAIRVDTAIWSRRVFWVALASTVRMVSNSRTSTYKLHTRPRDEIEKRSNDATSLFLEMAKDNIARLELKKMTLMKIGALRHSRYTGNISVQWTDSTLGPAHGEQCDLLIASPPYGDNVSTIPYGQYSFLPLQWIDLKDIDANIDPRLLSNTYAIDTDSLGGKKRGALDCVSELCGRSKSFEEVIVDLKSEPRKQSTKVAAFFRDFDRALAATLKHLRGNSYMVWIVGNRRVAKRPVPLHRILVELLECRGAKFITSLDRNIYSKKMATRNDIALTMSQERVIVMRKGAS